MEYEYEHLQKNSDMKKNITKLMAAVLCFAVVWIAVGCKKPEEVKSPTVTLIKDSIVVSHDKARLWAEVVDDGGAMITQCGFCYGLAGASLDTVLCSANKGRFSVEVNNLLPSTTYNCKAFARNVNGYGYSDEFAFATLSHSGVMVSTFEAADITQFTAVVGGCVAADAGIEVTERGVCYSTESEVSMSDSHIACGSGVGEFRVTLENLMPDVMYYYCAYAIVPDGVVYGHKKMFMPLTEPMEVLTVEVSDVVSTRARCEGFVVRDGGLAVTERGFCWDTEPHPTLDGLHVKTGSGTGSFVGYLSGIQRGVTYYVRAYSINEAGVVYGNDLVFVPDSPNISYPDGALPGLFSISEEQRVRFSKGNLQYRPYFDQWRFAECQWDFVGGEVLGDEPCTVGTVYENSVKCENQLVGYTYNGWIDLFGWGTSGWNNGNQYYKPWNYMSNDIYNPYYGPYGNHDLTGEYAHSDWGVHANISNGGSRQWRTLTLEECGYLLDERTTESGIRYAKATVAGIFGLVLLPDDWNASNYLLSDANMPFASPLANVISAMDWIDILEPMGAVFLPAAGARFSSYSYADGYYHTYYFNSSTFEFLDFGRINSEGIYWTSTQGIGMNCASALGVTEYYIGLGDSEGRSYGNSVRLVTPE